MAGDLRVRQLEDRIRTLTAQLLERRVKDPRLGFVTVTDVRLTGDLSQATIYTTAMGDDAARASTHEALVSATGMLRTELGRRLGMRHTPAITFVSDTSQDSARHLEELLSRARASDEEIARAAVGAQPAGDADPYRVAGDRDDDADDEHLTGPGPDRDAGTATCTR